MYEHELKNFLK